MLLELRNYLRESRGYMVKDFPVKVYKISFDVGFVNHLGESGFIRAIPESFFLVDVNPAVDAIKSALVEMNRLVEKSEYKHHFCLALKDNTANREIVKQNKDLTSDNVEVYFVGAVGVTEFQALLVEDCDCEDGFH